MKSYHIIHIAHNTEPQLIIKTTVLNEREVMENGEEKIMFFFFFLQLSNLCLHASLSKLHFIFIQSRSAV